MSREIDKQKKPVTILIADDDPDDRLMTKEAFEENFLLNDIHFVEDGEQLFEYLHHEDKEKYPMPGLILLDLNMPKKDGREALRDLKTHPEFKRIPVIILTTSKAEEDILKSYDLGVNCFISKPVTFVELVKVTKSLGNYWFEIVELPINLRND
jgi:two-component system, response regulator